DSYQRGIELYDAQTGALVRTLPEGAYSFAFSPDGGLIVGATTSGPRLWNAADGTVIRTFSPGGSLFAFTSDGRFLAIGQANFEGAVRIYRTADGALVQTINSTRIQYPRSVLFAPDRPVLVIAGSRDTEVPIGTLLSDEVIEEYRLDGSRVWAYEHT